MKTQFPDDSLFSGPVASLESKMGGRAERGRSSDILAFKPSRVEGEAKIDRVAERPARQTLRDFLILNCFGVEQKLILYFSAVIEIS